MPTGGYASQLESEQAYVDRAYARLDDIRGNVKSRLDAVRAAGSHGSPTQRTERDSFATMYEDRLTQLRAVEDRLVFGRLDHQDGSTRYIGRIGLSDSNHEPIVTDWRAEAARPFYEATPKNRGDVVMRRHLTLHFRQVTGIEDEVLDVHNDHISQAAAHGTLTGEGALLASLSSKRTGKMTDIVATIQAEQDRIIRSDMNKAIVVQGGPGTGKTAVALHRAAYLLYTHRRKLERSGVLIVGPSTSFLHYIDQVLPSLGETGVVSRTINQLIPGITAEYNDSPAAARIKGSKRMAHAIANAVAARERVPQSLPTLRINGISLPVKASDIEQALADAHRTRKPHNQARVTFVRSALEALLARYRNSLDYDPEQSELNDAMQQLRMDDKLRVCLNLAWLPMTGSWLIDQLLSKPAQLQRFAPWLSQEEIETIIRPKGSPFTRSDIALLDEAMELLGDDPRLEAQAQAKAQERAEQEQYASQTLAQAGIGSGIVTSSMLVDQMNGTDSELLAQKASQDRQWTYGHIVVDEAQELTDMDWRMLIRRCPSRSFTIVGDVAQTAALAGTRSWQATMDKLFGHAGWDLYELTINYRNPQEVCAISDAFARAEGLYISTQHAVRSVPESVEQRIVENSGDIAIELEKLLPELIESIVSTDGSGRIAIIAPDQSQDMYHKTVASIIKRTQSPTMARYLLNQPQWDAQVSVCGTLDVKGLEYDAVIVVEPAQLYQQAASRLVAASDLYVAMTRPTQKLLIVRTIQDKAELDI